MTDSKDYNEWFIMALKDQKSAKILFEHEADNEIVCFHCQQAIEKYLKGYLVYKTGMLHEGHSLIKLCKKAMQYDPIFSQFIKDLALVNSYYIETRYPSLDPLVVTKEEAAECMDITMRIIRAIDPLLG